MWKETVIFFEVILIINNLFSSYKCSMVVEPESVQLGLSIDKYLS